MSHTRYDDLVYTKVQERLPYCSHSKAPQRHHRRAGGEWGKFQEGKFAIPNLEELCESGFIEIIHSQRCSSCAHLCKAINLYFVYNINISLKSVFEIHGANLPHYHCQLTPLVGHPSDMFKHSSLQGLYTPAQRSPGLKVPTPENFQLLNIGIVSEKPKLTSAENIPCHFDNDSCLCVNHQMQFFFCVCPRNLVPLPKPGRNPWHSEYLFLSAPTACVLHRWLGNINRQ
ncbi:hypothetical protein OUZ56_009798 [Daphnia magna]|uniref:Uncharacterized protein n=1 Tax=Daphnia magna TaxID=35525 RepID=A0ABR0AGY8_9CRUS|nr:hypothetical protein OUZ56_009798 [Daphnia magna]